MLGARHGTACVPARLAAVAAAGFMTVYVFAVLAGTPSPNHPAGASLVDTALLPLAQQLIQEGRVAANPIVVVADDAVDPSAAV